MSVYMQGESEKCDKEIEKIVNMASMQMWCISGIIFFLLMLVLTLVFLFGKSLITRKACFFSALVCLFITLFANFAAVIGDDDIENNRINVKNMATGESEDVSFSELSEYLKNALK